MSNEGGGGVAKRVYDNLVLIGGQLLLEVEGTTQEDLWQHSYITIDNLAGATLLRGNFTTVIELIVLDSSDITTIECPNLTATNEVRLEGLTALTALSFPVLTSAPWGIVVDGSPLLTELSFPSLASIRNLSLYNNAALTTVSMPVVTALGDGRYGYYHLQNNALTEAFVN